MEEWRDVVGYEELYKISNLGNIKSLPRYKNNNGGMQWTKERLLKPVITSLGYKRIGLTDKNGFKKLHCIHRLVGKSFLTNENNFEEINHKDGNKHNNSVSNLEWCSRTQNIKHAYDNGLRPTFRELKNEIEVLKEKVKKLENNIYRIGE